MKDQNDTLHLTIRVRQGRTVLARCLQILTRRGFTLTELTTEQAAGGKAILHCTLCGPPNWHYTLPDILQRLIDVEAVEKVANQ